MAAANDVSVIDGLGFTKVIKTIPGRARNHQSGNRGHPE